MPTDNERLDRLFEYTKFHIGIYILAAGGMITIASSPRLGTFFDGLSEPLLGIAIVAMGLAGLAGGLIASSCASAKSFDEVWDEPIAPWTVPKRWRWPGHSWAWLEHRAFWASAIAFGAAVLWS